MPRGPRLDAPGVLHHIMARGIERRKIFLDDADRDDFVSRMAKLAKEKVWSIYAWALIPNHFHILARTEGLPLSRSMRRLMTGYAGAFNRRHHRSGHVFQNRFRSIVVEEEPYFLELVRYLHLNPLRAGVVRNLAELHRYPYGGHAVLMGAAEADWQSTNEVLGRYGGTIAAARRRYREFVQGGVGKGRRLDLMGGGLVRSAGGWEAVRQLGRGREAFVGDERVLGSSGFVKGLAKEVNRTGDRFGRRSAVSFEMLLSRISEDYGVKPERVIETGRARDISQVRAVLAYVWVEWLGRSGREAAKRLGVSPVAVYKAVKKISERNNLPESSLTRWCN